MTASEATTKAIVTTASGGVAAPTKERAVSIFEAAAERYEMNRDELVQALKAVAMPKNSTVGQCAAFMMVCQAYELNPFLNHIHAFIDRDGTVKPLVGIDGWSAIADDRDQFDGCAFEDGPLVDFDVCTGWNGEVKTRKLPAWVNVKIFRKDRSHAFEGKEWLEECYRSSNKKGGGRIPGSWDTTTRRRLRNKAFAEAVRMAFGIGLNSGEKDDPFESDVEVLRTTALERGADEEQEPTTLAEIAEAIDFDETSDDEDGHGNDFDDEDDRDEDDDGTADDVLDLMDDGEGEPDEEPKPEISPPSKQSPNEAKPISKAQRSKIMRAFEAGEIDVEDLRAWVERKTGKAGSNLGGLTFTQAKELLADATSGMLEGYAKRPPDEET
ncbi:MAG TPA: recombinase RecT [Anaerolineae bacterium]|nr:recombinase RecT [Anaerolineae bacterium]